MYARAARETNAHILHVLDGSQKGRFGGHSDILVLGQQALFKIQLKAVSICGCNTRHQNDFTDIDAWLDLEKASSWVNLDSAAHSNLGHKGTAHWFS